MLAGLLMNTHSNSLFNFDILYKTFNINISDEQDVRKRTQV